MNPERKYIFLSFSTRDDSLAHTLRRALDAQAVDLWMDQRDLPYSSALEPDLCQAIERASHVIALVSVQALNSGWVAAEIRHALQVQKTRSDDYRVIAVLCPPLEPQAIVPLFGGQPRVLMLGEGGVPALIPELLAALGLRAKVGPFPFTAPEAKPLEELILELREPSFTESGEEKLITATGQLRYRPADHGPEVQLDPLPFTAPLGSIQEGELAWYLERYWYWPSGIFQQRAQRVEEALPRWGQELYAAFATPPVQELLQSLRTGGEQVARRFTVFVDQDLTPRSTEEGRAARHAATQLLSLPWELLHDGQSYLFQGEARWRVRRRLPNRILKKPVTTATPIRVLLVSPRPQDERAGYIDHRATARPVVEALSQLGDLARLKLLVPPTFQALQDELARASGRGEPYHVVHFDGHGVYDRLHGLGALCFEDERDLHLLSRRRSRLVDAEELGQALREYRVPLFFLEACQSAVAEQDPTASVAGRLLQAGVASVIAMSHAVLVETARRFVDAFYRKLVEGGRIGEATLAGQQALHEAPSRGRVFQAELRLQDWFVPVLFQEEADPQLVTQVLPEVHRDILAHPSRHALGNLPDAPTHSFVGRSHEMLMTERLLEQERYVVLRGHGGEGKTTLATELARWLVVTHRFARAAFVDLDKLRDARAVLHAIGEQLVPNFLAQAGQQPAVAEQIVSRALGEHATVLVLDNMESVLPSPSEKRSPGASVDEPELLAQLFQLLERLSKVGHTRLIFTSRERISKPFHENELPVGRLSKKEAIELVSLVLGRSYLSPQAGVQDTSEEAIEALVDTVHYHSRSLVLLTRELARSGVRHTTEHLRHLMANLAQRYPDDRERSLFASVELSLRRLSPSTRAKLGPLAVFQGGGHVVSIGDVLGLDMEKDEHFALAREIEAVGLGALMYRAHLRLDPALGPALLHGMDGQVLQEARRRFSHSMVALSEALYQMQVTDISMLAAVLPLELSNLMEAVEYFRSQRDAERVIHLATAIEGLLKHHNRPHALAHLARTCAEAKKELGGWSHTQFLAAGSEVDRLLAKAHPMKALRAIEELIRQAEAAGEDAFPEAAYDLAQLYYKLGRAFRRASRSQDALLTLDRSLSKFEHVARRGNNHARVMLSTIQTDRGDCLRNIGRFEEAITAYQESIRLGKAVGSQRHVAIASSQLGLLFERQGKYQEAIEAHTQSLEFFKGLNEPGTLALAWARLGNLHLQLHDYEAAEPALLSSMRLAVEAGDLLHEASVMNSLGLLYEHMARPEDATRFFRRAEDLLMKLGEHLQASGTLFNLARLLFRQTNLDEARLELKKSLDLARPFGPEGAPWDKLNELARIEWAVGHEKEARAAHEQGVNAYLAYRREGGENVERAGFSDVLDGIAHGAVQDMLDGLEEILADPSTQPRERALARALRSLLKGSRDPRVLADLELHCADAAELQLLLEKLPFPERPKEPHG